MIVAAVIASYLLTIFFYAGRRRLKAAGGSTLAYHFFDKSLEFLIPFAVIGSAYCLLALFVSGTSDATTIGRLIFLDKLVGSFKWLASWLKVGALLALGILLVLYLLSLTRIPTKYTSKLIPIFKKYQKLVKPVSVIAILLFSFTFFGTQAGEPEARLRFRIKGVEGQYGDLRQEVEEVVSQRVAKQLLEKVKLNLPAEERDDLIEQNAYYVALAGFVAEYRDYKKDFGGRAPAAEVIVNKPKPPPDPPPGPDTRGPAPPDSGPPPVGNSTDPIGKKPNTSPDARAKKPAGIERARPPEPGGRTVYNAFVEGERAARSAADHPPPPPAEATAEKIGAARKAVRDFGSRAQEQVVTLLKSDHGRELALQVPKSLTSQVNDIVFKTLTDRYPILEPIIGVFAEMLEKDLETRTQKAIDKITGAAARNPAGIDKIIDEETAKVVRDTRVTFPETILRKARSARAGLRQRIDDIRSVSKWFTSKKREREERLEARRRQEEQLLTDVDEQITLLSCKNEGLRKQAIEKLAEVGQRLTLPQVKQIESLLSNTEFRFIESPSRPGSYELAPVRYYAAEALLRINSPHVGIGVQEQATSIANNFKARQAPLGNRYLSSSEVASFGGTAP